MIRSVNALLGRIVRALDEQFPKVEYASWRRCEELIPHAQACATLIAQHQLIFPEVGDLLTKAGWYLREQEQYTQAAHILQQALTIAERSLGSDHSYLGVILNNLASLYQDQGRYEEAEPLLRRALTINEQALPPDHPHTATTLENYASLLRELNRPREAQPLEQHAQAMRARLSSKSNK